MDAKSVFQHLCPIHLKKVDAIKEKVENILHAGFLYPIPLIDWVSNIILIMKKKGTIRFCVDYRDIN